MTLQGMCSLVAVLAAKSTGCEKNKTCRPLDKGLHLHKYEKLGDDIS